MVAIAALPPAVSMVVTVQTTSTRAWTRMHLTTTRRRRASCPHRRGLVTLTVTTVQAATTRLCAAGMAVTAAKIPAWMKLNSTSVDKCRTCAGIRSLTITPHWMTVWQKKPVGWQMAIAISVMATTTTTQLRAIGMAVIAASIRVPTVCTPVGSTVMTAWIRGRTQPVRRRFSRTLMMATVTITPTTTLHVRGTEVIAVKLIARTRCIRAEQEGTIA
mmetsp:Transcript_13470/g.19542  ORF Transcript_13470/g.19542 Transcript_13470/m.19542 type:complete len:217 (+) Transcript_13470:2000-2650(+)